MNLLITREDDMMVWLIWFHAAIVFIPALFLFAELEWKDWTESHLRRWRH